MRPWPVLLMMDTSDALLAWLVMDWSVTERSCDSGRMSLSDDMDTSSAECMDVSVSGEVLSSDVSMSSCASAAVLRSLSTTSALLLAASKLSDRSSSSPSSELRLFSTNERRMDDVRRAGVDAACVLGVFVPVVMDQRDSGFICCLGVCGGCSDARREPSEDREMPEKALDTRSSSTVRVEEPVDDTEEVDTWEMGLERGAWSSLRGTISFSLLLWWELLLPLRLLLWLLLPLPLLPDVRLSAARDPPLLVFECDASLSTPDMRLPAGALSCWSHSICSSCFSLRNDDLLRRP